MSEDRAVEVVETAASRKKRGHYRVSVRVAKALALLASGECRTQQQAADGAGLTKRALQMALRKDSVKAYMREMIMEHLGVGALRASRTMTALLGSENAMVQYRSSSYLLATGAGISPPPPATTQVNILNTLPPAGYVIDLSYARDPAAPLTAADQAALDRVVAERLGGVTLYGPAGGAVIEGSATPAEVPAGAGPVVVARDAQGVRAMAAPQPPRQVDRE